jgi:hypothetical protein
MTTKKMMTEKESGIVADVFDVVEEKPIPVIQEAPSGVGGRYIEIGGGKRIPASE